jgi:hypothetical protein
MFCITPFWSCSINLKVGLGEAWRPIALIMLIVYGYAVAVLTAGCVLLSWMRLRRVWQHLVAGGVIGVAPYLVYQSLDGQGFAALLPQLDQIPFILIGATFLVWMAKSLSIDHLGSA